MLELYRELYRANWSYQPTRIVLANTSNLMIWVRTNYLQLTNKDDHDVKDDFGSLAEDADLYSVEFYVNNKIARRVFWEYQVQLHSSIGGRLQNGMLIIQCFQFPCRLEKPHS